MERATRRVGVALMAASVIFVVYRVRALVTEAGKETITGIFGPQLVVAVPAYFAALTLFHVAWSLLVLSALPTDERSLRQAWAITARASLGKYLPGNVGHFAGRQVLVTQLGWPKFGAVGASLIEIVALPLTGLLVLLVGLIYVPDFRTTLIKTSLPITLAVLGVAGLVLATLAWINRRSPLVVKLRDHATIFRGVIWKVLSCYTAFLVIGGVVQALLIGEQNLLRVVLASTAAFMVGYLTPGVPAGIGVREAVLLLLIDLEGSVVAAGVLGFRLVMMLADILVFVVGSALSAQRRSQVTDP